MAQFKFLASVATMAVTGVTALAASPAGATEVGTATATFEASFLEYSVASRDGRHIAVGDVNLPNRGVHILDTDTLDVNFVATPSNAQAGMAAFSPDGDTLYQTSYETDEILVIDVATAQIVDSLSNSDTDSPWTMVISPDGNTLYIGDYDAGALVEYDLLTDTSTVVDSVSDPYSMSISADGSTIYNVGWAGDVDVYDTASGAVVDSWDSPGGNYYASCLSPDGQTLYLPRNNSDEIYALSTEDGSIRASASMSIVGDVWGCAVSPDSDTLYVAYDEIGSVDADDHTIVLSPGAIRAYAAGDLDFIEELMFSNVAATTSISFISDCRAFVFGTYGNAQELNEGPDCEAAHESSALAETGPDRGLRTGGIAALSAVVVGVVLIRRRRILSALSTR